MNQQHAINGWTKAGMATLLLALLLLTTGCALSGKRTLAGASVLSYVPYRAATKPIKPTPYQAEPVFFGYHGTCWRSWPDCWMECPSFDVADEQLYDLPASSPEPIPAPATEPVPATIH
jgi:hypothetical protein